MESYHPQCRISKFANILVKICAHWRHVYPTRKNQGGRMRTHHTSQSQAPSCFYGRGTSVDWAGTNNTHYAWLFERVMSALWSVQPLTVTQSLHGVLASFQSVTHLKCIFTALHGMQRGLNDEISVRLSVCPSVCPSICLSVKRVHCDKTEERYVLIFISHERTFILVLWEEEWLVGGDPFYLKFRVNRPALERNRRFWTNNRSQRLSRTT